MRSMIRHRCASQFSGMGAKRSEHFRSPQRSEDGRKGEGKILKPDAGSARKVNDSFYLCVAYMFVSGFIIGLIYAITH